MPYRKNVFILGAGSSRHAGAPLLGDFIDRARELLDRHELSADDEPRFTRVLEYRTRHDIAEKQANLDLNNLEHLFGLVDVHRRLDADAWEVHEDLTFLILRTLEATILEKEKRVGVIFATEQGNKQRDSRSFVSEHFVDIVARRWDQPETIENRDSIISLNYDLLMEQAMARRQITPNYSITQRSGDSLNHPNEKAKLKLLKLHGSANWAICSDKNCQRVKIYPADEPLAFTTESEECPTCGKALKPFIVPPTWSKGELRLPLLSVWSDAYGELLQARRWILIGMSIPQTDQFLHFLFGLALQNNLQLDRILVINPQSGQLYGSLFQDLPKRITFQHIPETFERILGDGGLPLALGQTYTQPGHAW